MATGARGTDIFPTRINFRSPCSYVKFKTNQQRLRSNDKVIADTVYGKVKGVKWQSIYGNNYYSFEGIPFAKPPVGELRFKAPVEPDHWTEVRRCTRVRSKPCQVNIVLNLVQGSEDCLYLNVYTREVSLVNVYLLSLLNKSFLLFSCIHTSHSPFWFGFMAVDSKWVRPPAISTVPIT